MKVFGFLYNDNINESSWATMSLHKTKEGAEKALLEHKEEAKKERDEYFKNCKENGFVPYSLFGSNSDWRIQEFEILP